MKALERLLPYMRPYRRGFTVGLTLVVIGNLFTVAGPWILKLAIDALGEELSVASIRRYAAIIVGVALVGGVARWQMREILNGLSRRIETDLRNDLFGHLMRLPPSFFDGWRTGDLMSRATNDVQAVRMVAGPAIMYTVNTVTVAGLALALMVWIDARLTVIAMIPMLVVPPAVFLFGKRIHARFERIQAQFSEISNHAQENLSGVRIVKAYAQEEAQAAAFRGLNEEYKDRNLALARVWGAFHPSLIFFTGLASVVVLWYGGGRVIGGHISVGDFVAFFFYLTLLTWPMIALGWVTNLFQRGAASMGRLNQLLDAPRSIEDPPRPVAPASVRGEIVFENVSFRYAGAERDALHDVSFVIHPGQTAAVVGATASGKSTLVRLIPRLYDVTAGHIRVDGVDVRDYALESLRDAISVVPQEPFLFSMRLRRNIELDAPEEVDDQLDLAIDIAQLRETLGVLPSGLDTRLGERGVNLSGGQKQRATLARALYRDTPILILDDALSAVDAETEAEILRGLSRFMSNRTSIIVSHRVSAVRNADLILVLDDGRLVESGVHDELLAADGVYARLLERQLLAEELAGAATTT